MRRDDPDVFQVGPPHELPAPAALVIEALGPLVTPRRLARIEEVVSRRKRSVVPVLEGLTDPHNGSAVLRTADALGLQDVHVVEGAHGFMAARRVARGTHHWLDVWRHPSIGSCVERLREQGYGVYVAAMGSERRPEDLRGLDRVAVVFGSEHTGLSAESVARADGGFSVPMAGFVESLNVSVAAAITLYCLAAGRPGDLDSGAQARLTARFLMTCVQDAERVVREHVGSA